MPVASRALLCVCLTCSSWHMSLRDALKSRNPPSRFGLLYRMRLCLNPGIHMQRAYKQLWQNTAVAMFMEYLSHTESSYSPHYKSQLSVTLQLVHYSADIVIQLWAVRIQLLWILYTGLTSLILDFQTWGMCSPGIKIQLLNHAARWGA